MKYIIFVLFIMNIATMIFGYINGETNIMIFSGFVSILLFIALNGGQNG
jgi:uncharacterized membrane protein